MHSSFKSATFKGPTLTFKLLGSSSGSNSNIVLVSIDKLPGLVRKLTLQLLNILCWLRMRQVGMVLNKENISKLPLTVIVIEGKIFRPSSIVKVANETAFILKTSSKITENKYGLPGSVRKGTVMLAIDS